MAYVMVRQGPVVVNKGSWAEPAIWQVVQMNAHIMGDVILVVCVNAMMVLLELTVQHQCVGMGGQALSAQATVHAAKILCVDALGVGTVLLVIKYLVLKHVK